MSVFLFILTFNITSEREKKIYEKNFYKNIYIINVFGLFNSERYFYSG